MDIKPQARFLLIVHLLLLFKLGDTTSHNNNAIKASALKQWREKDGFLEKVAFEELKSNLEDETRKFEIGKVFEVVDIVKNLANKNHINKSSKVINVEAMDKITRVTFKTVLDKIRNEEDFDLEAILDDSIDSYLQTNPGGGGADSGDDSEPEVGGSLVAISDDLHLIMLYILILTTLTCLGAAVTALREILYLTIFKKTSKDTKVIEAC